MQGSWGADDPMFLRSGRALPKNRAIAIAELGIEGARSGAASDDSRSHSCDVAFLGDTIEHYRAANDVGHHEHVMRGSAFHMAMAVHQQHSQVAPLLLVMLPSLQEIDHHTFRFQHKSPQRGETCLEEVGH